MTTDERAKRIRGLRHDPLVRMRAQIVRDVLIGDMLRPFVGHGTDVAVHVSETARGLKITAWPVLGRRGWDAPWPADAVVHAVSKVEGPRTERVPFAGYADGVTRTVSFALVAPDFSSLFPTPESMADIPR